MQEFEWRELSSQDEIDSLMELYGDFHDACLVRLDYSGGAYVDEKFTMHFDAPRSARMTFQRQFPNPKTIELEFEDVARLHICAGDIGELIITGTSMFFSESNIFWANEYDVQPPMGNYKGTWICAEKARFRVID